MSVFHLPIPFQASKNDDPQARGSELAADLSYWGAVVVRWQGNPSTDFVISEQREVRRVVHLPTGMEQEVPFNADFELLGINVSMLELRKGL